VNLPPAILAMSVPHRGRAMGQLMQRYNQIVVAGLLCEDTTTGHVKTLGGQPQAFYQLAARDAANMQRGLALLADMLFAAGAKRVILPFHHISELANADEARRLVEQPIKPADWEVVTVHMMGTARMGRDRTAAVTDEFGLVHDVDRLMVSDASLFPTPIRVNPMETIMALATRAAGHVIDESRRYLS
jgi:choline dehydrogenase-like flavoprotein